MKTRVGLGVFVLAGLLVAVALAVLVSPRASGEPDGLNRVAIDNGFADAESPHALGDLPTAGYDDPVQSGLIGVALTFALAAGVLVVVRRRQRAP